MEFSHLAVYRRETPTTCGVWSYRVELRLAGVDSFSGDGRIAKGEWISDDRIIDGSGAPVDTVRLGHGDEIALTSLELISVTAARLAFRGGTVRLTLLSEGRRFETWTD